MTHKIKDAPNPEDGRFILVSDKVFSLLSGKREGNRGSRGCE